MAASAGVIIRPTLRVRLGKKLMGNVGAYVALAFYMIVAVFPVFWMLMTSFKADRDLVNPSTIPFWFQQPLTLDHYVYLFTATKFTTWLANTFTIAGSVVLITLTLSLPAAYALARLRFFAAEHIGIGFFLSYVVPPTILFLPLSQVVASHGLFNSKWGLVAVYPTFTIPFCLWLLAGFFRMVPMEIEEAALVDGCNRLQAVFRVVLPLSLPGILTVAIFAFTLAMQEYVYAATFVSSSPEKPVTLGVVTDLIRGDVYFWGSLMAGALVAGVPVAILYNFFLDYFVEGITGGALK
jgi:multiple sugar transport system permease protein